MGENFQYFFSFGIKFLINCKSKTWFLGSHKTLFYRNVNFEEICYLFCLQISKKRNFLFLHKKKNFPNREIFISKGNFQFSTSFGFKISYKFQNKNLGDFLKENFYFFPKYDLSIHLEPKNERIFGKFIKIKISLPKQNLRFFFMKSKKCFKITKIEGKFLFYTEIF